MADERLRRRERLRLRREFLRVYRDGARIRRQCLMLHARPNGLGYDRLGLAVGRKVGPAVTRNRTKRRLRELFRRNKRGLAGGSDIVVTALAGAGDSDFWTLRSQFLEGLEELERRLLAARSPRARPLPSSGSTRS